MFLTVLTQTDNLSIHSALLCTAASLLLGFISAVVYMYKQTYTNSFAITLTLLPILVQIVIMMVNGNLGTGIAVMGAFSLIRFRSVAGSSREICAIFFSMAIGLATGMGYLTFAAAFTAIIGAFTVLLNSMHFGERPGNNKSLRITIPETLDYTEVFTDLFSKYTTRSFLDNVKTTNLGSMYELRYQIELRDVKKEKEFIDALRCRNGNLTIACGKPSSVKEEL